jgi:hypothetical protein
MTPSIQFSKPWTLQSAAGRYGKTEFVFEHSGEEGRIEIALQGTGSEPDDVAYELTLRRIDEDDVGQVQREYHVGTYSGEAAAFDATEQLLKATQNAIENGVLQIGNHDDDAFERVVANFGDDTLTSLIRDVVEKLTQS